MQNPSNPQEFNLAMYEKITALGATPVVDDLFTEVATNRLWRQLLFLLAGGSGAAEQSFIYRPGAVAPLQAGVYSDWSALFADAILAPGPITIYIDDSIVSPAVIPAGNWFFPRLDVTLAGAFNFAGVPVVLSDGAIFRNLAGIDNFLQIINANTTTPAMTLPLPGPSGSVPVVILGCGVSVNNTGGAPMFAVPVNGVVAIRLLNNAAVLEDSVLVESGVLGTTTLILFCQDGAVVNADAISSNGPNALALFTFSAASRDVNFTNQPNFLGSVFADLLESAGNIQYVEGDLASWSGTPPGTVANALDRIAAALGPIL